MRIRGVLLDAGDTLVGPVGGRWNPRFDFEDVLLRHVPDAPAERFAEAFAAGDRFLGASTSTAPRAEYHRIVLGALGITEPSAALLDDLERPSSVPVLEPFPEVRGVLEELRARDVRMGVVSDAWPELEELFEQLELAGFFDVFVVSALMGCRKPDPRMYRAASDGLDLAPEECLFVDDDSALVRAAVELGYRGATIRRAGPIPEVGRCITSLTDVLRILDEEG